MQTIISASFDSVDEADRAIARLKHSIRELKVEAVGDQPGSLPSEAPYTASVYYPWRVNQAGNELNAMPKELGSRVLYTSDVLGLPIYHDGSTTIQAALPAREAEHARAILVNAGGRQIRIR